MANLPVIRGSLIDTEIARYRMAAGDIIYLEDSDMYVRLHDTKVRPCNNPSSVGVYQTADNHKSYLQLYTGQMFELESLFRETVTVLSSIREPTNEGDGIIELHNKFNDLATYRLDLGEIQALFIDAVDIASIGDGIANWAGEVDSHQFEFLANAFEHYLGIGGDNPIGVKLTVSTGDCLTPIDVIYLADWVEDSDIYREIAGNTRYRVLSVDSQAAATAANNYRKRMEEIERRAVFEIMKNTLESLKANNHTREHCSEGDIDPGAIHIRRSTGTASAFESESTAY